MEAKWSNSDGKYRQGCVRRNVARPGAVQSRLMAGQSMNIQLVQQIRLAADYLGTLGKVVS